MLKDMLQISEEAWQCLCLSGCAGATQGGQPSFLEVLVQIPWGGRGDSSLYCACIEQRREVTSPEAQHHPGELFHIVSLGVECSCEVARAEWDLVALPGWIHAGRGKAWCHGLQCWHSLRGSQQSYWHEWPLVWAVCWGAGGAFTACTVIPGKSVSG